MIFVTVKWPKMAPRCPQDGLKMVPRWPKMAPRWSQDGPKMAPIKTAPTGIKIAQDNSKWPEMASSKPEEGPRIAQNWRSRVSEVQILQNRLCRRRSSLRQGPRRPKVALREPKMSKNGPKTARSWPQDGSRTTPRRTKWRSRVSEVRILQHRLCIVCLQKSQH